MDPLVEMLLGFGLVLTRTSGLVLSAPVLGFGTGFSGYKIGLVVVLAFLLYVVVQPAVGEVGTFAYGAMMVREALIGVFLGFLLHLAMLTLHVAGELVGHEMGFMLARQADPVTGVQTSLITSLYENLFVLALLALNGHHWLIASLGRSFERAPVGELGLGAELMPTIQAMFGQMFTAGIVFAAPVMVFLFVVSILIGLLARVVPTLNMLEIGFSVRVLISIGCMFAFAPLIEPAMANLHSDFSDWLERGLEAL